MGPMQHCLSKIRGRVASIRRHKTVTFITAYDPFLQKFIQLKGSPGVEKVIGCPGSAFEAEVDKKEENQIVTVKWSQKPIKVRCILNCVEE